MVQALNLCLFGAALLGDVFFFFFFCFSLASFAFLSAAF
jgi:hypothetical protein